MQMGRFRRILEGISVYAAFIVLFSIQTKVNPIEIIIINYSSVGEISPYMGKKTGKNIIIMNEIT